MPPWYLDPQVRSTPTSNFSKLRTKMSTKNSRYVISESLRWWISCIGPESAKRTAQYKDALLAVALKFLDSPGSFTAFTMSCSPPRYFSVVWMEECPSRNWICSRSPPRMLPSSGTPCFKATNSSLPASTGLCCRRKKNCGPNWIANNESYWVKVSHPVVRSADDPGLCETIIPYPQGAFIMTDRRLR
jgi:hypothetical protein